jgi:hypothetical protein
MLCKIWGFHSNDYEECRLLGYKNSVHTSQETRYVSAKEPSRLMLCKILGFRGGDYEECRLMGYKTTVRASHETHYLSTTALSRLMLCKIWGFHGGDYEECCLLGFLRSVLLLLVTVNLFTSSSILVTLMRVTCSSETSVLTRATRRNISEDSVLHCHTDCPVDNAVFSLSSRFRSTSL